MSNYVINQYNIVDVTKTLAPDNKTMLGIVDQIKLRNDIMDDLQWEEGTGLTNHVIGQIVSRPTITETADNKGYGKGKDEIINLTEEACQIGADNEIDVRTLDRHPNPAAFRAQKDDSFITSHGEKLIDLFFKGNKKTNPLQIDGLFNRADWGVKTKANVTDVGGSTGTLMNAWILQHGENGLKMWYPRGSTAGLNIQDKGEVRVSDADGNPYYAQVTHFDWSFGLGIYDPRTVQRLCNIKAGDTAVALEDYLVTALNKLPMRGQNAVIYLPRILFNVLDIRAMNKSNAAYRVEDVFGRQVTTFRGVPVRMVEALDSVTGALA